MSTTGNILTLKLVLNQEPGRKADLRKSFQIVEYSDDTTEKTVGDDGSFTQGFCLSTSDSSCSYLPFHLKLF